MEMAYSNYEVQHFHARVRDHHAHVAAGSIRQGEEVCLSSTPFSVDDDSPGDESPDGGSPAAISMASRGSRSCNTVRNDSPVRQVISPPPCWRPSPWSPSRSAPDLRIARPAGTVASPYTKRVVGAATASGAARAKSPFWLSSPDSAQPHPQLVLGMGEAVESQPQPPGSGDREDSTTDNHHTTVLAVAQSPRGGWCPWWCWEHAQASCCSQWPLWAPPTHTGRSSRALQISIQRADLETVRSQFRG
ncbi:uncharacterized protein LOC142570378 [Dermacentor variabilis]|uniref:uncharacterized protein LOC142570378 n=1 Tax=Dermacentor variabilis TaxID=34621 RepID=UPI003F5B1325